MVGHGFHMLLFLAYYYVVAVVHEGFHVVAACLVGEAWVREHVAAWRVVYSELGSHATDTREHFSLECT